MNLYQYYACLTCKVIRINNIYYCLQLQNITLLKGTHYETKNKKSNLWLRNKELNSRHERISRSVKNDYIIIIEETKNLRYYTKNTSLGRYLIFRQYKVVIS